MSGDGEWIDDVPGQQTAPRREEAGAYVEDLPSVEEPRAWAQLAIVVADGSESMRWELHPDTSVENSTAGCKADAVNIATRELVNRLAASDKKGNYDFAFVAFNDHVTDSRDPKKITEAGGSFDPTANGIGGTSYAAGLEKAEQIARDYLAAQHQGLPSGVVVLLLGDGQDNRDASAAKAAADRIKGMGNAQIAAAFFATKGDPSTGASFLQELASSANLYSTVYNAEQLRKFFHDSVTEAQFGS